VRVAGADTVIDYTKTDLRTAVQEATDGTGVDVVLDTVGGDLTLAALRCLRFEGRLVLIGFTGGSAARLPANHLLVKNVDVVGVYWGPYQTRCPARTRAAFERLATWYRDGRLKPRVAARFPLEQTGAALERLLAREFAGKVVIEVSPATQRQS